MNIYDIWPCFAILAVLLLLFSTPVFKFIDEPSGKGRVSTLDGLRGFLALGVFIHHGVVNYAYLKGGGWTFPPVRFYGVLGQVAVAYFFMISGFLFWAKLLREQKRVNWTALYIGRLFRIVPVYLAAVIGMLLIVFSRTGFVLHEPAAKIAGEVTRWLGFGFFGKSEINGYDNLVPIIGMAWSLHFEWIYYFSLRFTYYLAINRFRLVFVVAGWVATMAATFFLHGGGVTYAALFFSGMAAAGLMHEGWKPKIDARLGALAVLASLTLLLQCFNEIHNGFCIMLLASSFFIICLGNDLFGLLTSMAAQRLGHISYGIYLMQGIMLAVFYETDAAKTFAFSSDGAYWLTVLLCGIILAAVAAIIYAVVERPGIRLGRRIVSASGARSRGG